MEFCEDGMLFTSTLHAGTNRRNRLLALGRFWQIPSRFLVRSYWFISYNTGFIYNEASTDKRMLQFNVHKLKSASKRSCLTLDKTLKVNSFCLSQVYCFIQSIEGLVMDYLQLCYKESLTQVFPCEHCNIFKNAVLKNICKRLVLKCRLQQQ